MIVPRGVLRRGLAAAALLIVALGSRAPAQGPLPAGLVYLRDIDPTIAQDVRYATRNNFTGRPLPGYDAGECILTRAAALALKQVQADLAAARLSLKVYDCYRPVRATRAMVRWAYDPHSESRRFYPALQKASLLNGYIASASRHATGFAVDLTMVSIPAPVPAAFDAAATYGPCTGPLDRRAPDSSIDMGTGYDCFDPLSHTNNAGVGPQQRQRRTQLVAAMARHGFRNYFREWWHFTFGGASHAPSFDVPIAPHR
jgi:D-alanyl-D-alanine dipeptidase